MNLTRTTEFHTNGEDQGALMREVAAGNESAFNALCRQFHGLVYTTVYRVINS